MEVYSESDIHRAYLRGKSVGKISGGILVGILIVGTMGGAGGVFTAISLMQGTVYQVNAKNTRMATAASAPSAKLTKLSFNDMPPPPPPPPGYGN